MRGRLAFAVAIGLALLSSGCAARTKTAAPAIASNPPGASVVASDSALALRTYLHGWMLRFNDRALGGSAASSGPADELESVFPQVPMNDFTTVTVWRMRLEPLGGSSASHATYRVVFDLWRGNPLSSARPAEALEASATYDVSQEAEQGHWRIKIVSKPPEQSIFPKSRDAGAEAEDRAVPDVLSAIRHHTFAASYDSDPQALAKELKEFAEQTIRDAGLEPDVSLQSIASADKQEPRPGTRVEVGSVVHVRIGFGD